ncbi:hypothetical protein [Aggregatilinea lenta]|nr:hypothetical protein [Aggregatilinea lenta]
MAKEGSAEAYRDRGNHIVISGIEHPGDFEVRADTDRRGLYWIRLI